MPSQPTLVFLHGFAESHEIWTDFTRNFPPTYQVLTLDLLGHGTQLHDIDDYSMEAQAAYVQAELEAAGVERAVFIGHSMGGYVALAFAEKYPEQVLGLCLFHSSAQADTKEKKVNRDKNAGFVERHSVAKFMDTFIRPLLAPANRDQMPEQLAFLEELGKATPQTTILGGLRAMRDRPDRMQVLREAKFPVLFIAGKEDLAVPLTSTLEQVALPAVSSGLFLADVGHLGFVERPTETRRAVLDFAAGIFAK
jgi:pimeloyl-ACP methyl ester carboxylesterase